jgi:hypothetical protein
MAHTFRIRLFTSHDLSDQSTLGRLWSLLDDPVVRPTKYDSSEQTRKEFRPDAVADAAELYENRRYLFVRGASADFLAQFNRARDPLSAWTMWLDATALEGERADDWLQWLFRVCGEFPVLFGLGSTEEEQSAKHANVQATDRGGVVRGARGISINEFFQYLPGLYWLTIFGPELVRAFGEDKLSALPGVRVHEIGSGQIAIELDEPPETDDLDARLEKEADLADRLGAEFFFDRNRPDVEFRQVPELLEALEANDV